jgi:hypothetical protein
MPYHACYYLSEARELKGPHTLIPQYLCVIAIVFQFKNKRDKREAIPASTRRHRRMLPAGCIVPSAIGIASSEASSFRFAFMN